MTPAVLAVQPDSSLFGSYPARPSPALRSRGAKGREQQDDDRRRRQPDGHARPRPGSGTTLLSWPALFCSRRSLARTMLDASTLATVGLGLVMLPVVLALASSFLPAAPTRPTRSVALLVLGDLGFVPGSVSALHFLQESYRADRAHMPSPCRTSPRPSCRFSAGLARASSPPPQRAADGAHA
jgi:hypothetical protein